MTNTKLIIIEGIPGSGKSTTAGIANDILRDKNIPTKLFLEGNKEHPADYDTYSYFTELEWNALLSTYYELAPTLSNCVEKSEYGYLFPRFKLNKTLPNQLTDYLWEKDVYEIPLELHMKLIIEKWERFRDHAIFDQDTYVFECCFIQNPVTISMIKYGVSSGVILNYVKKLEEIIRPLNPILIYVDQNNLNKSFKKAVEERPKEWSEGFMNYYTNQGYGKQHGLKGLDGTLAVLHARKELEERIVQQLTMKSFIVDNSKFDMDLYKRSIEEIINNNILK